MANLKQETLQALKARGYRPYDIAWVAGSSFKVDEETFWALADENYDKGCSEPQIAGDLQIRMKDGSAFIRESKGGESWRWVAPEPPCARDDLFAVMRSQAVRRGGAGAQGAEALAQMNLTRAEREPDEEVIG